MTTSMARVAARTTCLAHGCFIFSARTYAIRIHMSRQANPYSCVATPTQLSSQPIAPLKARTASSGVLFLRLRCAAIRCCNRLTSSLARISAASWLFRCPNRPPTRCFKAVWIIAVHQHLTVVVAFQHQCIATAQGLFDMRGTASGIGQYAQPSGTVAEDELHRLDGIVRNGIGDHLDAADRERNDGDRSRGYWRCRRKISPGCARCRE